MNLTRDQLAAGRSASLARQAEAQAARDAVHEPNPYTRRRFNDLGNLTRKPASWWDDVYVPPMDVTEVVW